MRKVLLTGGAGFIGTYVTQELVDRGYEVCIVDNLSKDGSRFSTHPQVSFLQADLTDKKSVAACFSSFDSCIHLAAKIGGIGYFHKYPATILAENNKMYDTVFELAAEYKYKKILYISSSMVYESTNVYPSEESSVAKIPPPVSSYGMSKLVGEYYCKSFWEEYKLPYVIVRPFNAYGINELPTDEIGYSHVIPDLIRKILRGQYPVELLGDGRQTRCFTHAKDIANGIVTAYESDKAINEEFNIGTDKETPILELAKQIYSLCGMKKPFEYKLIPGFTYDVKRRVPSVEKAKKLLNWKPTIGLDTALPEIIEWTRKQM